MTPDDSVAGTDWGNTGDPTGAIRFGMDRGRSPGPLGSLLAVGAGVIVALKTAQWLVGVSRGHHGSRKPRKRYRIPELTKRIYFAPGDRVRYGKEFLRTAGSGDWHLRRGRVLRVRKLAQYQGDPNPRQLVTVQWDGDDEPTKVLNESLGLVSRS